MIWITTDTHFGHRNMEQYCGRPKDFELVKKSIESSKVYNLLVSGQVIEILTNLK
mgnify:CR=1 FL=1